MMRIITATIALNRFRTRIDKIFQTLINMFPQWTLAIKSFPAYANRLVTWSGRSNRAITYIWNDTTTSPAGRGLNGYISSIRYDGESISLRRFSGVVWCQIIWQTQAQQASILILNEIKHRHVRSKLFHRRNMRALGLAKARERQKKKKKKKLSTRSCLSGQGQHARNDKTRWPERYFFFLLSSSADAK